LNFANRIKADISDLTLFQFRSNILLTFHQLKLFQSQEHWSASDASACSLLKKRLYSASNYN